MHRTRVQSDNVVGKPTRDDVARAANISGATVSRVLSGRTDLNVSPETRAKVLEAAKRLGYQPNASARALMTGRTGLVGLWMSFGYSRYRGKVLEQMRHIFSGTEFAMAVTDVDEDFDRHNSFERALRVPVDGIIAFDTSSSGEEFARNHDQLAPRTPFVGMGAYWYESKSYVGVDLRAGADEAMDHLLSTGRRKIAYLAPFDSDLINQGPRYDSYCEKMAEAGLETSVISTAAVRPIPLKAAFEEYFDSHSPPEAVLCMNDDLALTSSFVLTQLGLKVGEDVALVGFDGLDETEYSPCPITTVRQPIQQMCELTWKYLQCQMEDPMAPLQQTILKPELVIRESTRR